jgi:hypothetical protein
MHLHITFHDALYFLTGVVFPTYGVLEWIVKHFGKRIKRLLIRNPTKAALFEQYKTRAMGTKVK